MKAATLGMDIKSPKRLKKMTIKALAFELIPISVNQCQLRAVCCFNPNVKLISDRIRNYFTKKVIKLRNINTLSPKEMLK